MQDFEASLLRLVDKLTDGTKIAINETGTSLRLAPGEILGGQIEHELPSSSASPESNASAIPNPRGFAYFLEVAMFLGLFGKRPLQLRLMGPVSNFPEIGNLDNSLEIFKSVTIPTMNRLLGSPMISLKVDKQRRSVDLFVSVLPRNIAPVQNLGSEGKVKRVRGVAWTNKCSSQFTARMIESTRGELNPAVSDVWVFSDTFNENRGWESFGISLVSETDGGVFKGASDSVVRGGAEEAEELGREVARKLLGEIANGGMIDSSHQWMTVLIMALSGDHKVGKMYIGNKLDNYAVEVMRLVKDFFAVQFKFAPHPDSGEGIVIETVGCSLMNMARKTF
jgi:RNA 3'-terminal phosphate cyclase-like protein